MKGIRKQLKLNIVVNNNNMNLMRITGMIKGNNEKARTFNMNHYINRLIYQDLILLEGSKESRAMRLLALTIASRRDNIKVIEDEIEFYHSKILGLKEISEKEIIVQSESLKLKEEKDG